MATWTTSWKLSCASRPLPGASMLGRILSLLFNRENALALLLAVLLVLVFMFGIDTSPTWIYQGF